MYNKALDSYIYIFMLAIADQTAGPNLWKLFEETHVLLKLIRKFVLRVKAGT